MQDDARLVEASLQGDMQAFALLVDRYRYSVYGLCLGYTRDFDAAEDAAQEAFIAAFLKLRDLSAPEKFGTWLKSIAANACRLWMRQQGHCVPLQEADVETIPAVSIAVDESLGSIETRRLVLEAIVELPEAQREVVLLFYLEDRSLEQVATVLGLSIASVKQRLYRSRKRLQEIMLGMVEKTLEIQEMSDDFTERVLAAALVRGQCLLNERRWREAQTQFRRVARTVPRYIAAQKGLGLALKGEVDDRVELSEMEIDARLLAEAFAALEEAWRLGARDGETVWALAQLHESFDRWEDEGRLLEQYAQETDEAGQAFRALCHAARLKTYALKEYGPAVVLHGRALQLEEIGDDERLLSYCCNLYLSYIETGQAERWANETKTIYNRLGRPLSRAHYRYHRIRGALLIDLGEYREGLKICRAFLDEMESAEVDEPAELGWWINDMWGNILICQERLGNEEGVAKALAAAKANLVVYREEGEAKEEGGELRQKYQDGYFHALHSFGWACKQAHCIDTAIEVLERARRVRDAAAFCFYLAELKLIKGDRSGSLEILAHLRRVWPKWVQSGHFRRWFFGSEDFAGVHRDRDFLQQVEGAGA
ncbi:MAG: sigma-70 family RNA polymerase sigma factor [Candidatus Latescibacteria bacterium]|nr:sigma-70 family RNA polymerase sigma factor [Candidatus Latescibacterota bacterium]